MIQAEELAGEQIFVGVALGTKNFKAVVVDGDGKSGVFLFSKAVAPQEAQTFVDIAPFQGEDVEVRTFAGFAAFHQQFLGRRKGRQAFLGGEDGGDGLEFGVVGGRDR